MEFELAELFDLQMGKTPARNEPKYWENGNNRWMSIADLSTIDKFIDNTKECISDLALQDTKIYRIPENTVVMSFKLSIGKVAITKCPMYSNEAIVSFLPKKGVNVLANYLYYLLKAKRWDDAGNKAVKGVTLNKISLSRAKIRLHDLAEQKHICNILDELSAAVRLRRIQLAKLDELVKARFVEMFGDLKRNPKNWATETVSTVTRDIIAGTSVNGENRKLKAGESAVLKVSAVTSGYFKPEEYKVIIENTTLRRRIFPLKGDILFSRANTRELVGATAIADADYPNLFLPDKIWKIETNEKINSVYFKTYLSDAYIRNLISSSASGTSGSMFNVSMNKLRAMPVLVPDIGKQNAFAFFVERVDKSKVAVEMSGKCLTWIGRYVRCMDEVFSFPTLPFSRKYGLGICTGKTQAN